MSYEDQLQMDSILREKVADLIFLKDEMSGRELEFLTCSVRSSKPDEWSRILLARRNDVDQIVVSPPILTTVPPFKIRNLVDLSHSPVIEYNRPIIRANDPRGKFIVRGRVYYQTDYLLDGIIEPKDAEFVKWAQKILNIFKKNLVYIKEHGNYFGEGALEAERNGWKLVDFLTKNTTH